MYDKAAELHDYFHVSDHVCDGIEYLVHSCSLPRWCLIHALPRASRRVLYTMCGP